jgi:creatinine amidohydrolase
MKMREVRWERVFPDQLEQVTAIQPHVGTRLYALLEFESNYKGFTGDGSNTGDHAGRVETSLLWALEPECVDISRIPDPGMVGTHFALGQDAYQSQRKTGELMVADEVEWLGNKGRELLGVYDNIKPRHSLLTFRDVENLWHQVILLEVEEFETMKEIWAGQEPIPEDSPWCANMKTPDNWR